MKRIQLHRTKPARSSEYQNLRHVVPSLRLQRDVDKLEVVTEAARYIDQLHKTLIERFVLCGIPDSLKDILGTDNANELGSQHIMNLVANMATTQRQQMEIQQLEQQQQQQRHQPRDPNQSQRQNISHMEMIAPTNARRTTGSPQSKRINLRKQMQPAHRRHRHLAARGTWSPAATVSSSAKHAPLRTPTRPPRQPQTGGIIYRQAVHKRNQMPIVKKSYHLDDDEEVEKK